MIESLDESWMHRALALAERGRGHVEPNPLVGAVVVRDGVIVGEGWHQRFGGPHAEVLALEAAGDQACGATLYVTLEPCCHVGKTPPCTEALIQAGVKRIVAAMFDPFPQIAGQGIARLRAAGIEVTIGAGELDARRLNRPYLTLLLLGRPYVHAKWAMSLDGKLATRTGHSQWISGPEARGRVHQLRGRMDAILVGSGTVRADDPLLTARPPGPRVATRVIVSSSGTLPDGCQLLRSLDQAPVLVAAIAGRTDLRRRQGCEVLELPEDAGRVAIGSLMAELGRRRLTNLLVEGGSAIFGSLADAGLIDEAHVFVGAAVVGGSNAVTPVGGQGLDTVGAGRRVTVQALERVESDAYLRAIFESPVDSSPAQPAE